MNPILTQYLGSELQNKKYFFLPLLIVSIWWDRHFASLVGSCMKVFMTWLYLCETWGRIPQSVTALLNVYVFNLWNLQNNMKRYKNTCLKKNRILLSLTEQSWKLISGVVIYQGCWKWRWAACVLAGEREAVQGSERQRELISSEELSRRILVGFG